MMHFFGGPIIMVMEHACESVEAIPYTQSQSTPNKEITLKHVAIVVVVFRLVNSRSLQREWELPARIKSLREDPTHLSWVDFHIIHLFNLSRCK